MWYGAFCYRLDEKENAAPTESRSKPQMRVNTYQKHPELCSHSRSTSRVQSDLRIYRLVWSSLHYIEKGHGSASCKRLVPTKLLWKQRGPTALKVLWRFLASPALVHRVLFRALGCSFSIQIGSERALNLRPSSSAKKSKSGRLDKVRLKLKKANSWTCSGKLKEGVKFSLRKCMFLSYHSTENYYLPDPYCLMYLFDVKPSLPEQVLEFIAITGQNSTSLEFIFRGNLPTKAFE